MKGELIGGADITEELAASGELTRVLEERLGPSYRESAGERTVALHRPSVAELRWGRDRTRRRAEDAGLGPRAFEPTVELSR